MDQNADNPATDPEAIPTLDDAVDETGIGEIGQQAEARLAPMIESIAARLGPELTREFDRLVGDPVLQALSQGLDEYQQHMRAILLRELSQQLADEKPTDTDAEL